MNLNHHPNEPIKTTHEQSDPVLTELWRVKDSRATKYRNAAGLMRHLQKKYKTIVQS
jgi:transcriptional regulatory protein LevR